MRHEHKILKCKPPWHAVTQLPHATACHLLDFGLTLLMLQHDLVMLQHTACWFLYVGVHATTCFLVLRHAFLNFSFLARLVSFLLLLNLLTRVSSTR